MTYKPKYLGHVNLYVRDAERAEKFYADVLGLYTYERRPGQAVFMSADLEQAHEIALMHLGPDARGREENQVGLNHVAWRMDTFEDLKDLYKRLKEKDVKIEKISDHGISLGVYFRDPDGNGNEVYYEIPREQWPTGDKIFRGKFPMSLEEEHAEAKAI